MSAPAPGGPPVSGLATPSVALAVAAHPDDVEFQAGATLARWAAAGCAVHHLILTDGSKGTWDAGTDPAWLVHEREAEQRAAAIRLGGADGGVRFLRWPDGELEAGMRQRAQVAAAIREVRPEVVLGHDPWRRYRLHPDHRNAGWLVCDAIVAAHPDDVEFQAGATLARWASAGCAVHHLILTLSLIHI